MAKHSLVNNPAQSITATKKLISTSMLLPSILLLGSLAASTVHSQSLDSICGGIANAAGCKAQINIPTGASVKQCRKESFNVSCEKPALAIGALLITSKCTVESL